jgi:pimeloyl-ACP methyl ester carboxylesterase
VTQTFTAIDGVQIAWAEMGHGRPLLLLHGFVSDAAINWIKYGHAACLAEAGYRVIMPDLRGHGHSDRPHDPSLYPHDILADDQFALIDHLGLADFDLGGYSLGGRTVARMLARGCRPARAIISGMGLEGLTTTATRAAHFRNVFENIGQHERGSPAFMVEAFLKTTNADPIALLHLLDSFVDTSIEVLRELQTPISVICGADDQDNGSARALADTSLHATLITVPGNHMSAVAKPELGLAFRDALGA